MTGDDRILVFSDANHSITGIRYATGSTLVSSSTSTATSWDSTQASWGGVTGSTEENSLYLNNESKLTSKLSKDENGEVTAEFYFDHVKAAMTKAQKKELSKRMDQLTFILERAPKEQLALREEVQKQMAIIYLQQTAAVLGYDKWVSKKAIDEFRHKVEFKRPELIELEKFPRVIPEDAANKLFLAQEAKIFDSFWILTWNPKQEQLATVTERVIKKDPILFGQFSFDPDVFYYICDWIDETCDLTFDKMVAELKQLHPQYEPGQIKPVSQPDMCFLVQQARERHQLLQGTNSSRYKSDAVVGMLSNERFSWSTVRKIGSALLTQWRNRKK